ncbi:MAG: hypothetical protein V4714_04050 [Bacteroidota bacterium]
MKKPVIFSLAILMSCSFAMVSCKHDKDKLFPAKNSCRLDSIIYRYSDFSYTEGYAYYPNGKLKQHVSNPAQASEYSYEGNLVTESISTDRFPATHKITYELDAKKLAKKSYSFFSDEASNVAYDTTFYTFNTAGYLTKKVLKRTVKNFEQTTIANIETVTSYSIVSGNTTEELTKTTTNPGNFTSEQVSASYEFYSDKIRKEDSSQPFWLGKGNTNLVKTAFKHEADFEATTTEYTYEMNAKGYVSKATANGIPLTYYYTCQ